MRILPVFVKTLFFVLLCVLFLALGKKAEADYCDQYISCAKTCPCGSSGNTYWCEMSSHTCRRTCVDCSCGCGFNEYSSCSGPYPQCSKTRRCSCDSTIYQISKPCCEAPNVSPGISACGIALSESNIQIEEGRSFQVDVNVTYEQVSTVRNVSFTLDSIANAALQGPLDARGNITHVASVTDTTRSGDTFSEMLDGRIAGPTANLTVQATMAGGTT